MDVNTYGKYCDAAPGNIETKSLVDHTPKLRFTFNLNYIYKESVCVRCSNSFLQTTSSLFIYGSSTSLTLQHVVLLVTLLPFPSHQVATLWYSKSFCIRTRSEMEFQLLLNVRKVKWGDYRVRMDKGRYAKICTQYLAEAMKLLRHC